MKLTGISFINNNHTAYRVAPFKKHPDCLVFFRTDVEQEADKWGVISRTDEGDKNVLWYFDDQDKAHQFAELLTECLTKIKAFTDENI